MDKREIIERLDEIRADMKSGWYGAAADRVARLRRAVEEGSLGPRDELGALADRVASLEAKVRRLEPRDRVIESLFGQTG